MKVSFDTAPKLSNLTRSQVEYIREHLYYSQVFEYYGLNWVSDSTHQIRCPFHGADKSPSARFYEDSKRIFCFACNDGGDVVWFVRKRESHQSIRDTISFIGATFGIGLSEVDLQKRIELETSQQLRARTGKRKVMSDMYANRLNDKVYSIKRMEPSLVKVLDDLVVDFLRRKGEIDKQQCSYIKYTYVIRHWYSWCETVLNQVVASSMKTMGKVG